MFEGVYVAPQREVISASLAHILLSVQSPQRLLMAFFLISAQRQNAYFAPGRDAIE